MDPLRRLFRLQSSTNAVLIVLLAVIGWNMIRMAESLGKLQLTAALTSKERVQGGYPLSYVGPSEDWQLSTPRPFRSPYASTPTPTVTLNEASPTPSAQNSTLPTFFPPTATARVDLTHELMGIYARHFRRTRRSPTFSDVDEDLTIALKTAGYVDLSYYWIDDDHGPGFAVITHVERIEEDGAPAASNRWSFDLPPHTRFTLEELIKALLSADPGHYRLLALVVARKPLVEKNEQLSPEEVAVLNHGPSWLGVGPWSDQSLSANDHLTAYIYEFERKSRSDDPVLMASSAVSPVDHLKSSGLWRNFEAFSE